MDLSFLAAADVGLDPNASLFSAAALGALLTLTLMEIVLGIDNVVFVAILVDKLPKEQQKSGRLVGMGLALVMRVGLLFSISWVMGLTKPIVPLPDSLQTLLKLQGGLSGRDLILVAGGLFLIYKATKEIFEKLEAEAHVPGTDTGAGKATYGNVIFQLILIDLVFSLDSVITAVGMVSNITIMIVAMLVAVGVMMAAAESIGTFVREHPSVKILALSFLNLIGVMLLMEGMHQHINKGYIYSAMAFSLCVEFLNMRLRKKQRPVVQLHEPQIPAAKPAEKAAAH